MGGKIEKIQELHKLYTADAITKSEFEILKKEIIEEINPLEANKASDIQKPYIIQYGDGVSDVDGNAYKSVIIGSQEWLVENLRTTKYADGTHIPNVMDREEWKNVNTGAYCHYDNDSQYDSVYGKLYNCHAVETGKLCPTGWHVPTDAEWTLLEDYLSANGHSVKEGTALKSTSGWDNIYGRSGNGTDYYGLNSLPGGSRANNGSFYYTGSFGYWWSSSELGASFAPVRYLDFSNDIVNSFNYGKKNGFSVRCLKD